METREAVETTKQTFALREGGGVEIRHLHGTVLVRPGSGTAVRVEAEMPPGLRWEMTLDEAGDLAVRSTAQGLPPQAACTLWLPPGARLRAHLDEGVLRLEGVEARARLDTLTADIVLEACRGDWHLQTIGGSIRAREMEGSVSLQTVSGDVQLEACRLSEVQGVSVNGDFLLETPLSAGPYAFRTVSGDVLLRLPRGTDCDVDFRTLSGRLEAAFSAVYFPARGGGREVMIGEGGPQVQVETLSGELWLLEGASGAAEAA